MLYSEGKGTGLVFQDYAAGGSAQFGWYVTSPTHDRNQPNVDAQTIIIPPDSLAGGYDARFGGPTPWSEGLLKAPGYLKGQSATPTEKKAVLDFGGVLHAYTDSSTSAAEFISGVKSYNNGLNVTEDGRFVPTLFHQLQSQGWKVGTATSVAFNHASPAAMYAHNVYRDDYQDLARDMLGLSSIAQDDGKETQHPGLDVVLGAGHSTSPADVALHKTQGKNAFPSQNVFITDDDLRKIDVERGGKYVMAVRTPAANGGESLMNAAEKAARNGHRLFGFYGTLNGHLPYRTADGDYQPAIGIRLSRETYSPSDLSENPSLADMTRAAIHVLSAKKGQPFALFVEAGDVDFALHDNNLDNAIGAVYSGEEAVRAIIEWVEKNSNWDESLLIVTADHGHYLVIDDPTALLGMAKARK
jgi:alkaline phosphatase